MKKNGENVHIQIWAKKLFILFEFYTKLFIWCDPIKIDELFLMQVKPIKICPVSLARLVGHCIIYAGGLCSNLGHPTYPPYGWKKNLLKFPRNKKKVWKKEGSYWEIRN
jgi:hypothetical protein